MLVVSFKLTKYETLQEKNNLYKMTYNKITTKKNFIIEDDSKVFKTLYSYRLTRSTQTKVKVRREHF